MLAAISSIGLGPKSVPDNQPINVLEMQQHRRRRRVTRTSAGKVSPIYRQRDSRKTMSVPQMKRAAKKRRNMAKRGQR